jgi:hypothetical protein
VTTLYLEDQPGGVALVLRDANESPYRPAASVGAAYVELWKREKGSGIDTAVRVATYKPGSGFEFEYRPAVDRNLLMTTIPYSASGTPSTSLEDATWREMEHQRETEAPVIGQNAPATTDSVEIGITGFSLFARLRRVTVSANPDMSDPLAVLLFESDDYASHELPRFLTLSRFITAPLEIAMESGEALTLENSGETLPLTVYVTVAHSGGTVWAPESNVLKVTFAGGDGTGGSEGDFDPTPRDKSRLETAEA